MSSRNKQVRQYMDEKVKPDGEDAKIAREMATCAIEQVRQVVPHASTVQYTGSNYEGNATKNSSDYDVMIEVAPKDSKFQAEYTEQPGFSKLKYQSGAEQDYVERYVTKDGYLSGRDVVQKQVQPAVDKLIGVQNHGGHLDINGRQVDVKRSVHGPAITLDLKDGRHTAQVDIVPSIGQQHVVSGKRDVDYVAKPSKDSTAKDGDIQWRQSYSSQEKATFERIDEGNQAHREVLKTAKTIRSEDKQLSDMPSYLLKTTAMNQAKKDEQRVSQGAQPKDWGSEHTADRLQDMGKELARGLEKGYMEHPANPAINVLGNTTPEQRQRWGQDVGPDGAKLVEKTASNN